jgi:ADP-glucose pyrophosphorylase
MGFESNDGSTRARARTLGVLITEGRVLARPSGRAGAPMPFVSDATDGSYADCVDAGVVVIGLGGGRASHRNGAAATAVAEHVRDFDGPFAGTADAIYQNLTLVKHLEPVRVLVQVGDQLTDLDYRGLLAAHTGRTFGTTVGCAEVPAEVAQRFAVLGIGPGGRVVRLAQQPPQPQRLPGDPTRALIVVNVYVFDLEPLIDCLSVDAADPASTHDLNRDVLPLLVSAGDVAAYVFSGPQVLGRLAPR